jgi:hypothetical protein
MIFHSFQKNQGRTIIYAIEIDRAEIERTPFTVVDQDFFKACSEGKISKKVLGLSILARKIEDSREEREELQDPAKLEESLKKWDFSKLPTSPEDPAE